MTAPTRAARLVQLWLMTTVDDEAGTPGSELYADFRAFCEQQGAELVTSTMFGRQLNDLGYPARHTSAARMRALKVRAGLPRLTTAATGADPGVATAAANGSAAAESRRPQVNHSRSVEVADPAGRLGQGVDPQELLLTARPPEPARVTEDLLEVHPRFNLPESLGPGPAVTRGDLHERRPDRSARLTVKNARNPAWASTWQRRLDSAPDSRAQASEAWSLLRASMKRSRQDEGLADEAWERVTALLVEISNSVLPQAAADSGVHGHYPDGSIDARRTCPCEHCRWVFDPLDPIE